MSDTNEKVNPSDNNLKSFSTLVSTLEGGYLNDELSKDLRELIGDMSCIQQDQGGRAVSGKLTLEIDLKLDDGIMEISGKHKIKKPAQKRGRSIYWVTPENNLTQQDPRQRTFEFGGPQQPQKKHSLPYND